MAALLMDDIPQYSDFAKRFGKYQNEPLEDPLEKLVYLADNKYWKWNQPDRLDMTVSKILSRAREIDRRFIIDSNRINVGGPNHDAGNKRTCGSDEKETFLLPKVVAYKDFIDTKINEDKLGPRKEADKIYDSIREILSEEFCPSFYFIDGLPHPHLDREQDKISSAYWEDIRCIGPKKCHDRPEATFYYNNPFDPRIKFEGLTPWGKKLNESASQKQQPSTNENLFLAASDISGMLEQHTLQYRLFLRSLQSRQRTNPLHHWSNSKSDPKCQGHDLDLSRLENLPLRYDKNDKEMENIVEPLLRDEVKFLWMFDQQELNVHLEKEVQSGPGPIGPPSRRMWPLRQEMYPEQGNWPEENREPEQDLSRTAGTESQLNEVDGNIAVGLQTDPGWERSTPKWKDTYNWIPNMDAPAWKSASDPDLYRSSSQTHKIGATSSSSQGSKLSEEGCAMQNAHVIPPRVTSDQRLPSEHKARLPAVRTEVTSQEDTPTNAAPQNKREDRHRFWKDTVQALPRQRHDSLDSGSTDSATENAPPVKVHGHYTPADHFKYMVHQLAAEVRQEDDDSPPRGGYRGRPFGRQFVRGGQASRGRGTYTYRKKWPETETASNGRPFQEKRGFRNKFKWFSANYRDWNNDADDEQTTASRDRDDDIEMVDVDHEREKLVKNPKTDTNDKKVVADEVKEDDKLKDLMPGRGTCHVESSASVKQEFTDSNRGVTKEALGLDDENVNKMLKNAQENVTYSKVVNGAGHGAAKKESKKDSTHYVAGRQMSDAPSCPDQAVKNTVSDALASKSNAVKPKEHDLGEIFVYSFKHHKYVPKASSSLTDNDGTQKANISPRQPQAPPDDVTENATDNGHPDNQTFRQHDSVQNTWQFTSSGQNEVKSRKQVATNACRQKTQAVSSKQTLRCPDTWNMSAPPPNMTRPHSSQQTRPALGRNTPRFVRTPPQIVRQPNPWNRGPPPTGFQNIYRFSGPSPRQDVRFTPRMENQPPKPFQPHR